MEATPTAKTLILLSPNSHSPADFNSLFNNLNALIASSSFSNPNPKPPPNFLRSNLNFNFLSTTLSNQESVKPREKSASFNWLKPATRESPNVRALLKSLSVAEKAAIGAAAGGIAGAFTYVCLHPLDTIKTKLQTKGASEIYKGAFDVVVKTFQSRGILGFYSGVSAVIVGSTFSSAVYFGTCEFGKSILSKFAQFPAVLIPPTAGAMGNVMSSAIMVPKELITQRMQAGAKGRSWEVLLRILEKDGVLGLYAGYSATLLRNLPAGVLSYSSFEYLKAAVLRETKQTNLEPYQSVVCGAMAGAVSATLTTPLDVVKTRLMTQVHSEAMNKVAAAMYGGVATTVKQILKEEGWIGFTRGMGPRVFHSACFSAIGYFAFETARLTILNQHLKRKEAEEMAFVSDHNQSE
ncbi:protein MITOFERRINLIKE 1, chloroplastic [Andrographis paniculata]|uniref:protein MITOFERRINLIKE 1, chloroplastic n=1 Tax=Andrographis paniculata TaxID=175694 RepID=UPI0021E8E188|nr:protein MITOFERRINLIKE 1, chloroplastic [Andrographis paniculata]